MSSSFYVGFIPATITSIADAMAAVADISDHEDISLNNTCRSIWQCVLYALNNHSHETFREGLLLLIRDELFIFFSFGIFRPPMLNGKYVLQLWRRAWQNPMLIHDITYTFRDLGIAYMYEIRRGLVFEIQDQDLDLSYYSEDAEATFKELQKLPCLVHIDDMKLLITAHKQAVFTRDDDIIKSIVASPDSIHFISKMYILH